MDLGLMRDSLLPGGERAGKDPCLRGFVVQHDQVRGDGVQELAIMRNDQGTGRDRLKESCQCLLTGQIKVVRRFIEEQIVSATADEGSQSGTGLFAAGEFLQWRRPWLVAESEAIKSCLKFGHGLIAAFGFEGGIAGVVFREPGIGAFGIGQNRFDRQCGRNQTVAGSIGQIGQRSVLHIGEALTEETDPFAGRE